MNHLPSDSANGFTKLETACAVLGQSPQYTRTFHGSYVHASTAGTSSDNGPIGVDPLVPPGQKEADGLERFYGIRPGCRQTGCLYKLASSAERTLCSPTN